jgi:hypothetical protein
MVSDVSEEHTAPIFKVSQSVFAVMLKQWLGPSSTPQREPVVLQIQFYFI